MAQDLSKRGKVGDVYRGGSYKKASKAGYKTAGLSSAQMKKATTLKGKKISASQMKKAGELKPISSTTFVKGKGVVGPGGKAFTGTVQLASGKTASYVKGRRIGVGPAKKSAPPKRTGNAPASPRRNPPSGGKPVSGTSVKARKAMQKGRPNWQSGTSRAQATSLSSGLTSNQRNKLKSGRKNWKSGSVRPIHRNPVASWWSNVVSTPRAWSGGPQPKRKLR
jgi:hypothetical protein